MNACSDSVRKLAAPPVPRMFMMLCCRWQRLWMWFVAFGLAAGSGTASAAEVFEHSFGPATPGEPAIDRRYNPTLEHLRIVPNGWVVDFQGNGDEPMPTNGFRTRFSAEEDFVATLRFTIDRIDAPPEGSGAGLILRVVFGEDDQAASVAHLRLVNGDWVVRGHAQAGPDRGTTAVEKFVRPVRQVQIERTGGRLRFHGGTNPQALEFVGEFAAPPQPVKHFEIWATTGRTATRTQMRLESIRIEASGLSAGERAAPDPPRLWPWIAAGFALLAAGLVAYRVTRTA